MYLVLYTSVASSTIKHASVTLHIAEEAAHLAGWTARVEIFNHKLVGNEGTARSNHF